MLEKEKWHDVILAKTFDISDLVEDIILEDSLDEIAYRATFKIVVTPEVYRLKIAPWQSIAISAPLPDKVGKTPLYLGSIWELSSVDRGVKHLSTTVYERTIQIAKSEDEYLFPTGQTAGTRLKKYATDWGVTVGPFADTGIPLAKAMYRPQTIWSMIQADLKETVKKGGAMYRPRMTPSGLVLSKIGSNRYVWVLEAMEEVSQRRTLEGAVTQVKVLGKQQENKRTPVLAVVKGETAKYGTLQKVLQDDKLKNAAQAKTAGQKLLSGIQETFTVSGPDINEIRAGDKVILNNMGLIATSVRHELGNPGRMTLELAGENHVKRRYFLD